MHRQPLRDANDILNRIAQRQLIPAAWLTQQPGILQTPHSSIHIRYAPENVTLEVISMPNERKDGPAMLIRGQIEGISGEVALAAATIPAALLPTLLIGGLLLTCP